MGRILRLAGAGIVLAALSITAATAQQLDPKVVTFKLPDQIVWKDNPMGGNRSAVLQGDPSLLSELGTRLKASAAQQLRQLSGVHEMCRER